MEHAGLDPDRPLNEQLGAVKTDDVAAAISRLEERIDDLVSAQIPEPQPEPRQTFASQYASALHNASSKWFTPGGDDAA
jgi:hypothetical protein